MGCVGQPSIEDDITYRRRQIIEGSMFEDFVYMQLEEKLKVSIEGCNTREEQFSIGENYFGMEIKHDTLHEKTGNLFIEYKEKSISTNENWVESGIFRGDNSWLYLTGNNKVFYIFSIKDLRGAFHIADEHGEPKHSRVMSIRKTSWGFLLKGQEEINRYVLKTLIL